MLKRRPNLTKPVAQQRGARVSTTKTRAAPVGGWNASDPIATMPVRDAVELVNFFPRQRDVVTRGGRLTHCDVGTAEPVETIAEYEHGTVHKLLAASAGSIFDVSTDTAASLGTGFADDLWITTTLSNRMFFANGTDDMQVFDGTTLADAGFTGLALNLIKYVHVHQGRVYVVEKNSQSFWYGGVNAITGALAEFDLSLVGSFGGNLHSLVTISRDGGSGADDYLVALFDSGDAAIYQGTNPADSGAFSKVGFFKIGRPIAKRGAMDFGDDVLVVTERGYESVRVSLPFGDKPQTSRLISKKIQEAVTKTISSHIARGGAAIDTWGLAVYSKDQMLIVNVPYGEGTTQHVQNLNTGAWCRFDGFNARSWGRFGSSLYMGDGGGIVYRYTDEIHDDGVAIRAYALTAWDAMDSPGRTKHHKLQWIASDSEGVAATAPHDATPGAFTLSIGVGSNYGPVTVGGGAAVNQTISTAEWDVSEWDDADWEVESRTSIGWVKNGPVGYVSSARVTAEALHYRVSWSQITYIYETGELL